jgi:hypothetical protein
VNEGIQKPTVLEGASTSPKQQVQVVEASIKQPGVVKNGKEEKAPEAIRQIVCTKKGSEKWEVKFNGPVARRDVNRILVTIRVAFARQKRKQRMNKAMQERLASNDPLRAAHLESFNGKS